MNNIKYNFKSLFNYEESTAEAYIRNSKNLMKHVNSKIQKHPRLLELLGGNPISLIEENHKNHVDFIGNVLKYKQGSLLVSTLPWVYKAYSSKGIAYDYFKIELESWEGAIEEILEVNDAKSIIKVYDAMLNWHDEMIKLSKQESSHFSDQNIINEDQENIVTYLTSGDYRRLMILVEDKLKENSNFVDLYIEYLQPAMYRVGTLWELGKISVAHEHLATSTIARVMSSIYPNYVLTEIDKGVGIVSSGVDEYHQIGARMVADTLESDGWDIKFLGSNTPIEELLKMIDTVQPRFVAISITMSFHLDSLVHMINMIKEHDSDLKVMVGGLAINENPEIQHLIPADAFAKNAEESMMIARLWY